MALWCRRRRVAATGGGRSDHFAYCPSRRRSRIAATGHAGARLNRCNVLHLIRAVLEDPERVATEDVHFAECSLLGRGGCKEVAEGALGYLGVIPAAVSDRPGVDLWMRAPVTRLRLRRYVLAHRADAERPLCAGAVLQLLRGVIGPLPRAVVGRPNLVEGTGRERRTSSDAGLDLHVGHLLIQGPALELAVAVLAAVVAGTVKVTGPALACGLTPSCPSRGCTGVGAPALALAVILALALPLGQGLDGTREALELLLERPRLLGDHGLHDHVASRVAPAGCMPCHRAGLRAAALVLHLRLHPVDPSGVGVQLRAADERGEHLGRHELLKGRAAHPLWHLQARGADLFAQALPLRQRLPEPGHRGAARRLLVLAGLRVLQLRGTALPLAVQPAPKLRAAAVAGAGAGEEAVGDDVLHRLNQVMIGFRVTPSAVIVHNSRNLYSFAQRDRHWK